MTDTQFLDYVQQAVWLMIMLGAPILVTTMIVGIGISIFQAVTQIQEQTLTFVPKILVSLLVFLVTGPWMVSLIVEYAQNLFNDLARFS